MSRPAETPPDGITIRIPTFGFGRRQSNKIRIKKRPKSLSERSSPRAAFSEWVARRRRWLRCFFNREEPAYRKVYLGALWGEMGEYGLRFSTFVGIVFLIFAITNTKYLPKLRPPTTTIGTIILAFKFLITAVFYAIAIWEFRDLAGPIWWADRYAVAQVMNARQHKEVKRYERYGNTMVRLREQYKKKLPLEVANIRRLLELYRQYVLGVLSEESWEELSEYTKAQVDFFYQVIGIGENDKRFPEHALKQPEAPQNPTTAS